MVGRRIGNRRKNTGVVLPTTYLLLEMIMLLEIYDILKMIFVNSFVVVAGMAVLSFYFFFSVMKRYFIVLNRKPDIIDFDPRSRRDSIRRPPKSYR